MTMWYTRLAALLCGVLLATAGAWAQPPAPGPGGPPPPPREGRPDGDGRPDGEGRRGHWPDREEMRAIATEMGIDPETLEDEDVRDLIEIVRMARLARELGLGKEDAVAMMRTFDTYREKFWDLMKARRTAMGDLKTKIQAGAPPEELTAAVDKLLELEQQGGALKVESFRAAAEGLNVEQQAKLYVFVQEFDDDVRRMVMRIRQGDGRQGDGPRGEWGDRGRGRPDDEKPEAAEPPPAP